MSTNPTLDQQIYPFDARGIGRRFRHAAIFGALDALGFYPVSTDGWVKSLKA